MRLLPLVVGLALLACGCGAAATDLPPDAVVLPGAAVENMLRQCSRGAPEAGEATWQPGGADIAALEAGLADALRSRPETRSAPGALDWARAPEGWRRQYVGIVRGGRRFVYGNFYPRPAGAPGPEEPDWKSDIVLICDGGPALFGVEYDVAAGQFTHLAFNGSA